MALDYIDPDLPDYPFLPYQLTEDGFAVDEDSPPYDPDRVGRFSALKFIDDDASEAANFAVRKFNELKGADLKLVKVVRGNWVPDMFEALYFLTLECSDDCFYEAKIYMKMDYASSNLIIFRPAKFYEREDKKTDGEGVEETDGEGVGKTDGGDKANYAQGLVEYKRLKKSM